MHLLVEGSRGRWDKSAACVELHAKGCDTTHLYPVDICELEDVVEGFGDATSAEGRAWHCHYVDDSKLKEVKFAAECSDSSHSFSRQLAQLALYQVVYRR